MHTKYYNSNKEEVPSVTTILKVFNKEGLIEWSNYIGKKGIDYKKFIDGKAQFGTLVHELIEAELEKRKPEVDDSYKPILESAEELKEMFKKFNNNNLELSNVITELSLSCDNYGGTLDLIGDVNINGRCFKILGDFKTSKKPYSSYFIQLAGYLNLLKINKPEIYNKIEYGIIFSITSEGVKMKVITVKDLEKYFKPLFLSLLTSYTLWKSIGENEKNIFKTN